VQECPRSFRHRSIWSTFTCVLGDGIAWFAPIRPCLIVLSGPPQPKPAQPPLGASCVIGGNHGWFLSDQSPVQSLMPRARTRKPGLTMRFARGSALCRFWKGWGKTETHARRPHLNPRINRGLPIEDKSNGIHSRSRHSRARPAKPISRPLRAASHLGGASLHLAALPRRRRPRIGTCALLAGSTTEASARSAYR